MTRDRWMIGWGLIIVVLSLAAGWAAAYIAEREGHTASIHGCQRGIEERLNILEENEADIKGNKAIAADPKQPLLTKEARTDQYQTEERVEKKRRERVDPAHGGKLICSDAYPEPSPIPTPW